MNRKATSSMVDPTVFDASIRLASTLAMQAEADLPAAVSS